MYDYNMTSHIVSIPNGTITGTVATTLTDDAGKFQFQTVRLQGCGHHWWSSIHQSFNSKRYDYRSIRHRWTVDDWQVSIPNGTITGDALTARKSWTVRFQFQTVRLQEYPTPMDSRWLTSFNSKRYDYRANGCGWYIFDDVVSIPNGTITGRRRLRRRLRLRLVSIPNGTITGSAAHHGGCRYHGFQFQTVRLQGKACLPMADYYGGFNSKRYDYRRRTRVGLWGVC